jgi:HPt (histidine-containing phosphotransfer) domain-containing protein
MTANALQDDRAACIGAGMDDYVSKPIRVLELQAALTRCAVGTAAPPAHNGTAAVGAAASGAALDGAMVLDPGPLAELREVLGDDGASIDTLIDSYRLHSGQLIATLRAAAASGDATTVHRTAHTLKGQSGSLGARRVEIVSRRLEERTRGGELDDIAPLITQLEDELARASAALDAPSQA